jgi:tRNA(Arg) A34 adenosine deaminase TadA
MSFEERFLRRAIELSRSGMLDGKGGPFGCVIVKDGQVIGEGSNEVLASNDPTAHAEVVAIRNACTKLGTFQLVGCDVYASCEPCPMCLGAIYWARPARVIFANTKSEAQTIGFDDAFIYEEIQHPGPERSIPFLHVPMQDALDVFLEWKNESEKQEY